MCVCEAFVKVMQRRERKSEGEDTVQNDTDHNQVPMTQGCIFLLMSAHRDRTILVIFTQKVTIL